ncbi:MAG TPA: hypothetical protein VHU41_08425 [Thermoanaerobaculia bacterium]|jgi:hypothetical protein|nr:hypothetical protein [Thermoanaerobaculia bacterium]
MKRTMIVAALVLAVAPVTYAASVWTIGGQATTASFDNPCVKTVWEGDTVFFNTNDVPVTVKLIQQTSAQPLNPSSSEFTILPHAGAAFYQQAGLGKVAYSPDPLFIAQFDVPDGVLVEGRIDIGVNDCSKTVQPLGPVSGKAESPVFRSLAPAGATQRHLGTDLSSQAARVNVGVYNAGNVVAHAHVEVRRLVDDELLDQSDLQIQPNAVTQVALFGLGKLTQGPFHTTNPPQSGFWVAYTTVVVDQPSLSFASVLSTQGGSPLGQWYVPYSIVQSTNQ